MKIISWNVNGLRAIYKRNFLDWLKKIDADIICLQEIKIQKEQLSSDLLKPKGYEAFFSFAQKKGYSSVAVYTKKSPIAVKQKLCFTRFDNEGRILRLDFSDFSLINLYMPHGGRQKENLVYKLEVYKFLLGHLRKTLRQAQGRNIILIGDFNVAHTELDLARPKQNQNNIMFTPQERKQICKLIGLGFTDTFRMFHPAPFPPADNGIPIAKGEAVSLSDRHNPHNEERKGAGFHADGGHYTWWPYFANARARNLGWRIDYAFVSESLLPKIKKAFILPEVFGSDHCPIGIEIK